MFVMEKRTHYYVSPKNGLAWLMALCMVSSAVARIVIFGEKGTESSLVMWSQIILPIVAALLYAAITLLDGTERFYRTAVPVWLAAAYSGIRISCNVAYRPLVWLCWISLIFFAFLYTELVTGSRWKGIWLLLPLELLPVAAMLSFYRGELFSLSWAGLLPILPDLIMLGGGVVLVFAIRIHPLGEYHPTWGDRSDGRRIRSLDPMNQISPYIMVNRNDANNLFSDSFEVTGVDRYIRQKRREGMTNFGIMHVLLACYCRSIAKYPGLNRFLSGQKVYSRGEDIQFCLTVKKEMTADASETVIKVHLSPRDTAADVYRKVNEEVEKAKNAPLDSSFDSTAYVLTLIPGVFLKFTVWLLKTADYFGLIPKFLLEVSPFHGSVFLTSMGSLGIPPIYHHLYNFGNLPVFGAFGCKRKTLEVLEDGTVVQRKYIDFKFTTDERIVDGYYYAAFFKHFRRIFLHPDVLDRPPEEVVSDIA